MAGWYTWEAHPFLSRKETWMGGHEREVGRRDYDERREGKCDWLGND